jgi:glycine/D-amino acid oxidase-like deaminating enzyme
MVPRLADYLGNDGTMQASVSIDGGYYTKTPDNLPLIGAVPGGPEGSFICAGLSGYGVMAANAAGELLACHVAGEELPTAYVDDFRPERWMDSAYVDSVAAGSADKGLQI